MFCLKGHDLNQYSVCWLIRTQSICLFVCVSKYNLKTSHMSLKKMEVKMAKSSINHNPVLHELQAKFRFVNLSEVNLFRPN